MYANQLMGFHFDQFYLKNEYVWHNYANELIGFFVFQPKLVQHSTTKGTRMYP